MGAPRGLVAVRMSEAVAEYLEWRTAVKADSFNSVRNSRYELERLTTTLNNPMMYNVERNTLNRYVVKRREELTPSSLNQARTHVRTFIKWATDERYVPPGKNLIRDMGWKKEFKAKDRKRLTADRFQDLYDTAECTRDRTLFMVLTDTLMRGSEATTVQWGGVRLDDGMIDFKRWKTGQDADVPISGPLDQELRRYRVWYEQKIGRPATPDDYMLCRLDVLPGQRKSDDTIRLTPENPGGRLHVLVKGSLEAIGFDGDGVSLRGEGGHTIRRSAARALLEALFRDEGLSTDEALLMVMYMLGHKSLDMTMKYIGWDPDRQKVMTLLRGKDWWASARPPSVVRLAPLMPSKVS